MRQLSQLCRALSGTVKDAIGDIRDAIGDGHRHLVNNDFFVAILYVGDVPDTSLTGALHSTTNKAKVSGIDHTVDNYCLVTNSLIAIISTA